MDSAGDLQTRGWVAGQSFFVFGQLRGAIAFGEFGFHDYDALGRGNQEKIGLAQPARGMQPRVVERDPAQRNRLAPQPVRHSAFIGAATRSGSIRGARWKNRNRRNRNH